MYAGTVRRTSSAGPDVDIPYGQLLRCMQDYRQSVRYAVMVPDRTQLAAQRVSGWVRDRLRIELYVLQEADQVLSIPLSSRGRLNAPSTDTCSAKAIYEGVRRGCLENVIG